MGGGSGKRTRLNDGGAGEVIVEDGLSVGLENGLSRHGVSVVCIWFCFCGGNEHESENEVMGMEG